MAAACNRRSPDRYGVPRGLLGVAGSSCSAPHEQCGSGARIGRHRACAGAPRDAEGTHRPVSELSPGASGHWCAVLAREGPNLSRAARRPCKSALYRLRRATTPSVPAGADERRSPWCLHRAQCARGGRRDDGPSLSGRIVVPAIGRAKLGRACVRTPCRAPGTNTGPPLSAFCGFVPRLASAAFVALFVRGARASRFVRCLRDQASRTPPGRFPLRAPPAAGGPPETES